MALTKEAQSCWEIMKTKNNELMLAGKKLLRSLTKALLLIVIVISSLTVGWQQEAIAILAQGDAITDPKTILRNALPIDNEMVRRLQGDIEDISRQLRVKMWGKINRDIKDAGFILRVRRDKIMTGVPEEYQSQAESWLDEVATGVEELKELAKERDRESLYLKRRELLDIMTELEESMVVGYPFEIPEEYAHLPQLLGRATVEMQTDKGDLTVVIDGYSAPINGGNFVDLVNRGFYDGLDFNRAEDFYILQAGDPPGAEVGFIDPKTKEYRAIPFEVLVQGDPEPVYEITLEDLGRYLDTPALPFNAYGAIALARPEDDPNGGSSQFFFFKFDTELTPPGYNLMDGRYAVFGYVIEGKEVLEKLNAEDKIISVKVIEGLENLVEPKG